MASPNLEIVRGIYKAWAEGDFSSTEPFDAEIELLVVDGPTPVHAVGLAEVSAAWGDLLSAWRDFRTEAEEIRELDPELFLVLTTNTGQGKSSGVEIGEISTNGANVLHLRGGKVTKLVTYWNREGAFAALGLPSEPDA